MNWNIRFTKDMLAKAAAKGKSLITIGYTGTDFGRGEACMFWTDDQIRLLWLMAHEMNRGKTPREALALAESKIEDHEAKLAAAAAERTAEIAEAKAKKELERSPNHA